MKELIKVTTNEQGKKLVSARELYLGLGLNKTNWSRWHKANIVENEYFQNGNGWVGVRHYDEGIEIQDYAIVLEFAKHIAMMARTEKSHEYRNYFLECEELAKNQYANLSTEMKAIFMLDIKQQEMNARIEQLENTMTIDFGQQRELQKEVRNKVYGLLGSAKNEKLKGKLFSAIYKMLKDTFSVNSYCNISAKEYEQALKAVREWQPCEFMALAIQGANAQMKMF